MTDILFHHPFPISENPKTGSQIRPRRMLEAFEALGFNVVTVAGNSPERVSAMRRISKEIQRGRKFDFCYAESASTATALSDPNHLPLHPLADPAFFRILDRHSIPSGLFYRDVYWRFDEYKRSVKLHKRAVSIPFYLFDLKWYSRFVDRIYLPSLGMAKAIPGQNRYNFKALPPGTTTVHNSYNDYLKSDAGHQTTSLNIFYVGSITPPIYDISPLLRAVQSVADVHLDLCFPAPETDVLHSYQNSLLEGVTIHHVSGSDLFPLYERANIISLIMGPNPYRDFAMPVKLFEAISYGRPVIANRESAAGRFVIEHGFGWDFEDEPRLISLLEGLINDPQQVREATTRVGASASSHTWKARAAAVAEDLRSLR